MQLLITALGLKAHVEFQFLVWSLGRDPCQLQLLEGTVSGMALGLMDHFASDPREL